jgi:phosphomethylpyrimidine synthase
VLSPEELHRLASKTRRAMGAEGEMAACHSDQSADDAARRIQEQRLDPATLEPLDELDAVTAP